MYRPKIYHVFLLVLSLAWIIVINHIGTIRVFDRVFVFSDLVSRSNGYGNVVTSSTEQSHIFTAVGHVDCEFTALANQVLQKLKAEKPNTVFVYSWTAPSKEHFRAWLESRKKTKQIPEGHTSAPVIFNRMLQQRVFLGGVTELLEFVAESFPDVDLSEEHAKKRKLDGPKTRAKKVTVEDTPRASLDVDASQPLGQSHVERNDEMVSPPSSGSTSSLPLSTSSTSTTTTTSSYLRDPLNDFAPQITLKKNKVYTSYRLAEGKTVTNYRPMASALKARGWGYIQTAPLLSSFILVQDQTSAAHILKKYRKAIVNNIGYGGQSCFGGTKGTQIKCRSEFAQKFGCNYDSLGIQPPQYRLWILDECKRFFDVACANEPDRVWMEKPSGGQHGAGMSPRAGCAPIRAAHDNCYAEASKKKYIIMPYLTPALISGHKFDVRSFLLVASLDPQLAFYHDGFVRKANSQYSSDLSDRNAHITNAVSQKSEDHFYSFKRLQEILHQNSGFPKDYMERIFRDHAIKVQNYVFQVSRQFFSRRKGVYQIFALDWIVDSDGGVHMLEANSNPLVTVFKDMQDEMTETWDAMTELVLKIHTEPHTLVTPENPRLTAMPPNRFVYRGWHLIFNELEEKASGKPFNPCQVQVEQYSVSQGKFMPPGSIMSPPASVVKDTVSDTSSQVQAPIAGTVSSSSSSSSSLSSASTSSSLRSSGQVPREPEEVEQVEEELVEKETKEVEEEVEADIPTPEEEAPVSGSSETPYRVSPQEIQGVIRQLSRRACVELDPFKVFNDCEFIDRQLGPQDRTIRCRFTEQGYVYIIEPTDDKVVAKRPPMSERSSPGCHPIVMIAAGVHGNEQAGIVAGRHIRNRWFIKRARLIVVDRLNPKAAERRGRYIPKVPKGEHDLNRNFPASGIVGELARDIQRLVSYLQPHLFVDMHEGWGFYNRLRANYQKGGALVGNPKFSKGSSVISSPDAVPIAKFMINRVNELTVKDHSKDFLSIVPPIDTGLANYLMREYGTVSLVIETTSGSQQLGFRASQQLILVGTCLVVLGLVPVDFDGREGFDPSKACVAGLGSCSELHPGDMVLSSSPGLTDGAFQSPFDNGQPAFDNNQLQEHQMQDRQVDDVDVRADVDPDMEDVEKEIGEENNQDDEAEEEVEQEDERDEKQQQEQQQDYDNVVEEEEEELELV